MDLRELQPGDRVRVESPIATVPDDLVFVVMEVATIADSHRYQPRSRLEFTLAEALFGDAARVLWVADPDKTFDGDWVNGFPIVLAEGKAIGLDGVELSVRKVS